MNQAQVQIEYISLSFVGNLYLIFELALALLKR